MAGPETFHVFLSYNSNDKLAVRELDQALQQRDLSVWLDERELIPGGAWQEALEEIIETIPCAAVLVGKNGLSPWQTREMRACIAEFVQRGLPVIPVLLPSAPLKPSLPKFLQQLTWVDLRDGLTKEGLDRLEWGIKRIKANPYQQRGVQIPTLPPPDVTGWIETHRLPRTLKDVFGREDQIALMDEAWLDPHTNVISIVAWGGTGKSALVNFWLQSLEAKDYGGAQRVFAWSFYKQETTDPSISADLFIEYALKWFGDPEPSSGDSESKALRLLNLIRKQRTLLLLDGLEPVQHPPGPNEGGLKDDGLKRLLRELAAFNPGLCVVTSRLPLSDLANFEGSTAPQIKLSHLSDKAGAALLRNGEVQGTQAELEEAAHEFGGHALALTLVASYLRTAHYGNVHCRQHIPLLKEDQRDRGHAHRILAAYEGWFKAKPEGQMLRIIGLFDRPAKRAAIDALRADPGREHSVILTAHRDPLYNRGKLVNHPIGKDSPWDQLRLSR